MLLSVVVPMYNASKYLSSMKRSIEYCSHSNIEFILIDDGSKDDTYSECKKYFHDNKNVKIFHNNNHGVSYTRNYGVNKASGEYLMFWDADDILDKNWDECVIKAIEENIDCDMIFFCKNNSTCYPKKKDLVTSLIGVSKEFDNNYLAAPWSKVFNRNFIVNNNIKFNEKIIHGEDLLFNIEAILLSEKRKIINNSFYLYYINVNSVTHNFDNRFLDSNQKYIENLESLLKKNNLETDIIKKCISYSFINSMFIFAGKLSKVDEYKVALDIINDFYSREFYKDGLKKYITNKNIKFKNKVIYFCIKYRFLFLIEFILIKFRRKKIESYNNYILV